MTNRKHCARDGCPGLVKPGSNFDHCGGFCFTFARQVNFLTVKLTDPTLPDHLRDYYGGQWDALHAMEPFITAYAESWMARK